MNTHIFLRLSSICFIILELFDGNFNTNGCMNWDLCNYNLTINSTSKQVCFYGWITEYTNTVVHFRCNTHNRLNGRTFHHLLDSHEIITGNYSSLILH